MYYFHCLISIVGVSSVISQFIKTIMHYITCHRKEFATLLITLLHFCITQ